MQKNVYLILLTMQTFGPTQTQGNVIFPCIGGPKTHLGPK